MTSLIGAGCSSLRNDTAVPATETATQPESQSATEAATESATEAETNKQVLGDDAEPVDKIGVFRQATGIVDGAQGRASERFSSFMSQVDGFFGDGSDNANAVSNQSWARVRVDVEKPGDEDLDIGGSLKLRAVLPETERRFRVLLSTEDDDTQIGGATPERSSFSNNDDQDVSLALRFIRSARDTGSVNLDVGVRQRDDSVQYFGRINNTFKGDLSSKWYGRLSNSYYYFSKSGFENKLNLAFQRIFFNRQDLYFRTSTEFGWRKNQKGAVIGETLGLYSRISDSKSLAMEALASYHTALNPGVSDRFRGSELRLRWRHNVWRDWFFYEFWPSVVWPASNDYKRAYGALLRVEMVIGQQ